MIFIFEIDKPFQFKIDYFKSDVMTRICWLYFAISKLHIPWDDLVDRKKYQWLEK